MYFSDSTHHAEASGPLVKEETIFVGRLLAALCMLAVLFVACGTPAQAEDRPILTAAAAMRMLHGCIGKATHEGWLMHIAVIDSRARLKAYYL